MVFTSSALRRHFVSLVAVLLSASAFSKIFVSDQGDATVKIFNEFTGNYVGTRGAGFLQAPRGVAIGPDGLLYVADGIGSVLRFNRYTGKYMGSFGSGFLSSPYALAFDSKGVIYVSDAGLNEVVRFNPKTGNYRGSLGAGFLNGAVGLAIDRHDVLYVCSYFSNSVLRFKAMTGNYMGSLANGFAAAPYGLALDINEKLNVGDIGGKVLRFDPETGNYMGVYAAMQSTPLGIAATSGAVTIWPRPVTSHPNVVFVCDANSLQINRFDGYTGNYLGSFGHGIVLSPGFVALDNYPSATKWPIHHDPIPVVPNP